MARQLGRLKALQVSRLKEPGLYPDGSGLFLRISVNGKDREPARSWVWRFMLAGKPREMGLGSLRDVSLAEARGKVDLCRRQRASGIDPIEARKAIKAQKALEAASTVTLRECGEQYIAAHRPSWRNRRSAQQWESSLAAYAYPLIGGLSARAVDTGMVLNVLEPLWTRRPVTAARLRGRLECILDWAQARGYRGEGANPARWRGHLSNLLPAPSKMRHVKHHPALRYSEMGAFLADLRMQEGVAPRALEFTLLTAARTGETRFATWSEINLAERMWVIPPERTKTGKEHRIPLSVAALAVIERMKAVRSGEFLFPGAKPKKPLGKEALLVLLKSMGRDGFTTHGFRSTFRTWCAERTATPREICEAALGHTIGSDVERAYQRSDFFQRRVQLMTAWASHCATVERQDANSDVVVSIAG